MGENGIPTEYQNGGGDSRHENGDMFNGVLNGDHKHHSSKHKHKDKSHDKERRKETEEERRIRKEKEHEDREKRYKKEGKRLETEEERKTRKEKERREREERHKKEGRREETEEERATRKEKERSQKEDKCRNEGRKEETEEERAARKEKDRREREQRHKKEGRREETEEERKMRKEKDRREKDDKPQSRDKDQSRSHKETDDERRIRKERERRERKEREAEEHRMKIKEEDIEIKTEAEESQDYYNAGSANEEENDMECDVKEEQDSEEEAALAKKVSKSKDKKRKGQNVENDEEYSPSKKKKRPKVEKEEYEPEAEEYIQPEKIKKEKGKAKKVIKAPVKQETKPGKKGVKKEEPVVWKWWEEEKKDDGKKWHFLQHNGPLFAPDYERIPSKVRFYYDDKPMKLSQGAEEVATFYGRMLDHDYTTKEVFNKNFFKDWRKVMTNEEKEKIRDLSKCDFTEIDAHFKAASEQRKNRTKEEKKSEKEKNEAIAKEYGVCTIDGHEEKIGNFRIEPPGLFRGRGEHPKQGCLKRRTMPEDVIINCSADSECPQPPEGHKWKKVQHDNTVTWLASWQENVQNQIKYVMLNPSSKLKGEKDMMKYEKARQLKGCIEKIRQNYVSDLKSKEMRLRQRAVALYFIDKLALRAGNEKDDDSADTVGCCSLRVEHIKLHPEKEGKEHLVEFDFLGKDSIRYHNEVEVEKRVFKNVQLFMDNKKPGDDLFDRLNTTILNEYLNSLMPGLTAKVFRTYNASYVLQEELEKLTIEDDNVTAKVLSYNRANRQVAILCNHQRAIPKTHDKSMENLKIKIQTKREAVAKAEKEFKAIKKANKGSGTKPEVDKKKKSVDRLKEQLCKLETQEIDKDENKTIALGTSKLNYLDPRISVAWCKKFDVPIEKVYNKTQREKFRWAIEMAGPEYEF